MSVPNSLGKGQPASRRMCLAGVWDRNAPPVLVGHPRLAALVALQEIRKRGKYFVKICKPPVSLALVLQEENASQSSPCFGRTAKKTAK
jgi:hypothetical protein